MRGTLLLLVAVCFVLEACAECDFKYDISFFGGINGKTAYPFNRELDGFDFTGIRAEIALFDHDDPSVLQGIIRFVDDAYLVATRVKEYAAETGEAQVSYQPYSLLSTVVSLLQDCHPLRVDFVPRCDAPELGYSVLSSVNVVVD
ncbi:hypothetical protein QOT17_018420 [Balamuthia mandrillaris]